MRFDEIRLPAFGPFTDFTLTFPRGKHDVHLIYGPNEAGKSSLLRAVRGLLFGIPARTSDDFLHPYQRLLVGATISDGAERLSFFRRKGRQNTLRDAEGGVMDEARLKGMLGPVMKEQFESIFSLNTEDLRKGGEELLTGEGELGALLFSAARGGRAIEGTLKKLEEEAAGLFAPRGKKGQAVRSYSNEIKEAKKVEREHTLTPTRQSELEKELSQAREVLEAARKERLKLGLERDQMAHQLKALPILRKLEEAQQALAEIPLPKLAEGFAKAVREVLSKREQLTQSLAKNEAEAEAARKSVAELSQSTPIMEHEAAIESLHRGAQGHEQNLTALKKLKSVRKETQEELNHILGQIKLSVSELSQCSTVDLAALEQPCDQLQKAHQQLESTQVELLRVSRETKELEEDLSKLQPNELTPDLEDLEARLGHFEQEGKVLSELENTRDEATKSLANCLAHLGLAHLSHADVRAVHPPSTETARHHGKLITSLEQRHAQSLELLSKIRQQIEAQAPEVDEFHDADQALEVKPNQWKAARAHRQNLWQKLKEQILAHEQISPEQLTNFEQQLEHADGLAHRFMKQGERLGELKARNKQLYQLTQAAARAEEESEQLRRDLTEAKQAWRDELASVNAALTPPDQTHPPRSGLSPSEYLDWRQGWTQAIDLISQLEQVGRRLTQREGVQRELIADLQQQLTSKNREITPLAEQLRRRLREARTAEGAQETLRKQLEKIRSRKMKLEKDLPHHQQQHTHARQAWEEALSPCQLADQLTGQAPTLLLQHLRQRNHALELHRQHQQNCREIARLQAETKDFNHRLTAQLQTHGLALKEDANIAEQKLWQQLQRARQHQDQRQNLRTRLDQLSTEHHELSTKLHHQNTALEKLCKQANVTSETELPQALEAHEKRLRLQQQTTQCKTTLKTLAAPTPLDDFIQTTRSLKAEQLTERLSELETTLEEREGDYEEALRTHQNLLQKQKKLNDAQDTALQARQKHQNAQQSLAEAAKRYAILQLSISLLREQIERYRQQNQGPLLHAISRHFQTLTQGAYTGVATQSDERKPSAVQLVACRPASSDGLPETLTPPKLSEGTRDQLYLALRLAALERHLETYRPVPLVLDDILMTYDNQRASALLQALLPLARKTQILLFTHHQHLISLAQDISEEISIHQLADDSQPRPL